MLILSMKFNIMAKLLGEGFLVSLSIFVLTLLFSLPLGFIIYFGRSSKIKIIRIIFQIYISIMRGTPLMLQLFIVYFGPYYIFKLPLSNEYRFIAVIIGFVLNYAAYFAEIYRSGFDAIPKGQYMACKVLGLNKSQTFFQVILPQVIRNVIPPVTNEIITLIKDTSLAFAIGVIEMFTRAEQIASKNGNIIPYLIAAVFYYIFNYTVAFIIQKIEKRLNRYKKEGNV
mgnify:CR=1 FL=1